MCVSISATVALVCLFGPKVYIVIFQPHKNVRQSATPGLQGGGRGSAKPFIPSPNNANATTTSYSTYESHNGLARGANKGVTSAHVNTVETANDVFSDSMDDVDDFCDEPFIPKPTEDKATSTSDAYV